MSVVTPAAIVSEARSWIGTPYVHRSAQKGVGVDCSGLLRGVWSAVNCNSMPSVPMYTPDWNGPGTKEILYNRVKRYAKEIDILNVSYVSIMGMLQAGDVVLLRMVPNKAAKHCGIIAREGRVTLIHVYDQLTPRTSQVTEVEFDMVWLRRLAYLFRFAGGV